MNKITQLIIFGIIVISLLTFITGSFVKNQDNLGNIFVNENAYSSAPTYTTSTLTNNVAVSLISRATSSRTYARVCNYAGADIAWIYKQATSTGVIINNGSPIYASSTTSYPQHDACIKFDANDPYTGQIWGIVNATTTLTIEYLQN